MLFYSFVVLLFFMLEKKQSVPSKCIKIQG